MIGSNQHNFYPFRLHPRSLFSKSKRQHSTSCRPPLLLRPQNRKQSQYTNALVGKLITFNV